MKKVVIFIGLMIVGIIFFYETGLIDELQNVSAMQAWFHQQGFLGYFAFILLCIITASSCYQEDYWLSLPESPMVDS
jgi:hypothetical protein